MPRRRIGGFLPARADCDDLELRQRLQGRHMGERGEAPLRTGADDTDADSAARRHESPVQHLFDRARRLRCFRRSFKPPIDRFR
jgi:hypothetical protein